MRWNHCCEFRARVVSCLEEVKSSKPLTTSIALCGQPGVMPGGGAEDLDGQGIVHPQQMFHTKTSVGHFAEDMADDAVPTEPNDVYEIALCIYRTAYVRAKSAC